MLEGRTAAKKVISFLGQTCRIRLLLDQFAQQESHLICGETVDPLRKVSFNDHPLSEPFGIIFKTLFIKDSLADKCPNEIASLTSEKIALLSTRDDFLNDAVQAKIDFVAKQN